MRLSVCDYSFPLLPHDQVCRLARMLDFDALDLGLMGNRSHVRPEAIRGSARKMARPLKRKLERMQLNVADVFLIPWTDFETLAVNHPDASVRAQSRSLFDDALAFADELGAAGITTLPGIEWPNEPPDAGFQRAVEELEWRSNRAQENGLRFSIEAHLGSIVEDPAEVPRLLDAVSSMTLAFDITHFIYQGYRQRSLVPLAAHAGHVHVRGARPGRMQVGAAENEVDYDCLLESLRSVGYNAYVACEYVWVDWERCNECDNLSETIMLRDRVREFIDGASS